MAYLFNYLYNWVFVSTSGGAVITVEDYYDGVDAYWDGVDNYNDGVL